MSGHSTPKGHFTAVSAELTICGVASHGMRDPPKGVRGREEGHGETMVYTYSATKTGSVHVCV